MDKYKLEIFEELSRVLDRTREIERKENKVIFSDDVLVHISYAMEHLSGMFGTTEEALVKYSKDYLTKRN